MPPDLTGERAAAQRLVDDLRVELDGIVAEQAANPPDDEHDVEGSSVGYERARVSALLADAEARVRDLDSAVERMGTASYGRCEGCGRSIGEERLEALPAARRCVRCATERTAPDLRRPEPGHTGPPGLGSAP